jgi:hypothetical protein
MHKPLAPKAWNSIRLAARNSSAVSLSAAGGSLTTAATTEPADQTRPHVESGRVESGCPHNFGAVPPRSTVGRYLAHAAPAAGVQPV